MNNYNRAIVVITMFLVVTLSGARGQSCAEIAPVVRMARTKSMHTLTEASKQAGDSYRARLIFAYRSFQLHPQSKKAAERLLSLLPTDEAQQNVVMTLGDSLCDEESVADMKTLSQVNEGLARELARAVLLAPRFLPAYVRYATVAVGDPHSDYAVRMKRVCQQAHADFVSAVKQLPENQQLLFSKHVINPSSCAVLAVPEAAE